MTRDRTLFKVVAFTIAMVLVAAGLIVVFGQFRAGSTQSYHAQFADSSRLKAGGKVRIAGVVAGTVESVTLNPDTTVDVRFDLDRRYRLFTSTRAMIRYENLVGDRYLEIDPNAAGSQPGLPLGPDALIVEQNTEPALDLDALLGGLRPVTKGLDGNKINEITGAVIQLVQGQGGPLAQLLSSSSSFSQDLVRRRELIGDVITRLERVLAAIDAKSAEFDQSVGQLPELITGLAQNADPIAGTITQLASAEADLTELLQTSRRPVQGVVENARPLSTEFDDRKDEVNAIVDPLPDYYRRLRALGAYGSFFSIYFCEVKIKINGPAGSDIIAPLFSQPDPSKGRCSQ